MLFFVTWFGSAVQIGYTINKETNITNRTVRNLLKILTGWNWRGLDLGVGFGTTEHKSKDSTTANSLEEDLNPGPPDYKSGGS